MSEELSQRLRRLDLDLIEMSEVVESMVSRACRTISEQRRDLSEDVIATDEEVDRREVQIEEKCLEILALELDEMALRRVATVMKINGDLERIADLAANVAKRSRAVAGWREVDLFPLFERISTMAEKMVSEALGAFVNLDTTAALSVCQRDEEIDQLRERISRRLVQSMEDDPPMIEQGLQLVLAVRHFERIADRATNIAEDVIYLVEGQIARHRQDLGSKSP